MSAPAPPGGGTAQWTSRRRWLAVALAAYAVVLALALLTPTSGTQSSMAAWVVDIGRWVGVPERLATQPRAEFVCNALIVVPLAALGALVWPGGRWQSWTAWAFVGACAVELAQGLLLPMRTVSTADVVANTLGALAGALGVALLRLIVGLVVDDSN